MKGNKSISNQLIPPSKEDGRKAINSEIIVYSNRILFYSQS